MFSFTDHLLAVVTWRAMSHLLTLSLYKKEGKLGRCVVLFVENFIMGYLFLERVSLVNN